MTPRLCCLLALTFSLGSAAAVAQNPQPAPPGETPPRLAAPNGPNPPPEKTAPQAEKTVPEQQQAERDSGTLSNTLSRQHGTLHPPTVDPGMAVAPPPNSHGTMPVIPPPGSAGGDQRVVPK